MRDYMRALVVALVGGVGLIALLWVAPELRIPVLIGILLAIIGFLVYWLQRLIAERNSPQLCCLGFWTSLCDIEPCKTIDMNVLVSEKNDKGEKVTKTIKKTFEVFRHRGCKPMGVLGGGSSGYSVIRRDLKQIIPGDRTQIWVHSSPPEIFLEDAPVESEYKPLASVEPEIRNAIMQLDDYVAGAHVFVYYDPPDVDGRKMLSDQGYPFKDLYFALQAEHLESSKSHDRSMKTSTELAGINKIIAGEKKKELEGGLDGVQ